MLKNISPDTGLLSQARLSTAVHEAKVALIKAVWQPDWGDGPEQQALEFQQFANDELRDMYEAINARCPNLEKEVAR
jgi:hypothetical protein